MIRFNLLAHCLLVGSLFASGMIAYAGDPKPAVVFSDHAVLQRDIAVPVWGTSDAGAEIVVEFAGQKKTAVADAKGLWRVMLDAMPASAEPRELPKIMPPDDPSERSGYNYAIHHKIMTYPNTFMVTSADLGPGIHPLNISGYGIRSAMVAMNTVYGGKAEYYGPLYASHEIKDDKVIIKFTHTGQGLAFKNGNKLQGFAIAGDDRKFTWADATIEGDTVVVSSKTVAKPFAVRYAWAKQFPWANLFNKDTLPAQPFTTEP